MEAVNRQTTAAEKNATADRTVSSLSPDKLREWVAELQKMPADGSRDVVIRSVLAKLAYTSPQEALDLAVATQPRGSAEKIVRKVADVWAKTDEQAVFRYGGKLPQGVMRDNIRAASVRFRADKDARATFLAVSKMPYENGGSLVGIPLRLIALQNLDEAMQMAEDIPDQHVRDVAVGMAFDILTRQDPRKATEIFLKEQGSWRGIPMSYALGGRLADNSVTAALDVLNQITNFPAADHFIHGMIWSGGGKHLAALTENITRVQNPEYRHVISDSVARDLSKKDPSRAIAWAGTLADEEDKVRAYQGIGAGYAERDAQSAAEWLKTLPMGKDRRYAIFGYAFQNSPNDPEDSAAWALKIVEPEVRERLLRSVLAVWSSKDREKARAWAESAGYTYLLPSSLSAR